MASLYEMTGEFKRLFDTYEAIDELDETEQDSAREGWFEALSYLEDDMQDKAVNVGKYIKNLSVEVNGLKEEEARLKARRQAKEHTIERLKKYVIDCLETAHLSKAESPQIAISVRNTPESVTISNMEAFVIWAQSTDNDEFLRYKSPEPDKAAIKAALKNGANIPGAELTRSKALIIK